MARIGLLEAMARADLDALVEDVGRAYRPGAVERLGSADPQWREALDRAEAEVGDLYEALRRADATLARWRQRVTELHRLWTRVQEVPADAELEEAPILEEVA